MHLSPRLPPPRCSGVVPEQRQREGLFSVLRRQLVSSPKYNVFNWGFAPWESIMVGWLVPPQQPPPLPSSPPCPVLGLTGVDVSTSPHASVYVRYLMVKVHLN